MSGGSYNYLYIRSELDDLVNHLGDLRDMADRLAGLGYADDAARETEELLVIIRQWKIRAEVRVKRLADIWKAVEWWDSADWSEAALRGALLTYRGETCPHLKVRAYRLHRTCEECAAHWTETDDAPNGDPTA